MAVAPTAWSAVTGSQAIPTGPATVLNVIAGSGKFVKVTEFGVSFDGTSAAAAPVLVELCTSTQAGAGTPGAALTPALVSGGAGTTVQSTARALYTGEPTVVTPLKQWLVDPNKGLFIAQFPLGREPESDVAKAILIRMSAPAAVNARTYIEWEE